MTEKSKYLLPAGFRDLLSNEAEAEFFCTNTFLENFMAWGYSLVATPMVEFEDSLFDGSGKALMAKTLRLFDPASQRVMGVRADITTQIVRLFSSRMGAQKLPQRLCYAGNILRTTSANTRGDRELKQIGIELIDNKMDPRADAEVAIIAAESLLLAGIKNLTIDLNTPNLIKNLGIELTEEQKRKIEKREIADLPKEVAELIAASGAAGAAFKKVKMTPQIEYVREVFAEIEKHGVKTSLTVDFVENKGFEYHDTFSFSVFSKDVRDELGRGGRYSIGDLSATGATLYVNSFIDKIPAPAKIKAIKKLA